MDQRDVVGNVGLISQRNLSDEASEKAVQPDKIVLSNQHFYQG